MAIPKGKWVVDPSHSTVGFSVKHLMISKVKGHFTSYTGEAETTGDLADTHIVAKVDVVSIDTKDAGRDNHLRSADFFDVEKYPEMIFTSTRLEPTSKNDVFKVVGDLTVKGITKPVEATVEFGGIIEDPYGNTKGAAEVTFTIDRTVYGLTWNAALETGGVLVGNDVTVTLELQAVLQK